MSPMLFEAESARCRCHSHRRMNRGSYDENEPVQMSKPGNVKLLVSDTRWKKQKSDDL